MATGAEVLRMLIPTGGWSITGDDWVGVQFVEATPITEAQFKAGFAQFDSWKANQDAQLISDKTSATAKLEALGLTANDLKALGL
jgi:hypothetical protein